MTGSFCWEQLGFCGDHFDGALEFGDGAEGIAGAVDEERGCAQVWEMLRALLLGAARRMQRVGEQQEGGGEVWLFGAEHARLAPAIGVASEEDATGRELFYSSDCSGETGTVAGGVSGAGRAEGPHLTKGQVTAQHGEAGGGKSFGQRTKERGLCICAGAMGEDQAVAVGIFREVQESADGGIGGWVEKFAYGYFGQGMIVNPARQDAGGPAWANAISPRKKRGPLWI